VEKSGTVHDRGARIVRIEFEPGDAGLIFATSSDLRGLLVAERTMKEVEAAIPQAIEDLYAAAGERVVVSRVEAADATMKETWVAFPAEIARMALLNAST
jgi:hypothetical protein